MTELVRGRYEPLEVVGRGGQGEVLRALDRQHDRVVALKVRPAAGEGERAALLSEARILLALRPHPGLPLVREDFFDGDRYYVAMDWIEGASLRRFVQGPEGPSLGYEDALGVLAEVAQALDHLHAHDPPVVHRDVKPHNIVVTPEGRVVLVDFGIAGASGAIGTPGYAAPEVAMGEPPGPSADVFGLAATAFALLTGAPPRPGATTAWRGVPPERVAPIEAAMERSLALDPARRHPSASEFVDAMRGGASVPAHLPAEATSFVGRVQEAEEVAALLGAARAVTLTGAGGIGKTRLAQRVASTVRDRHPDGVWWVELGPLADPALVAQSVAGAIGVREEAGVAPVDAIAAAIGAGRTLLALDNCEHLIAGAAALAEALLAACPALTILATSREPLGIGAERPWLVPPLGLPDAAAPADPAGLLAFESVRLFCDRATQATPSFALDASNAATVAAICARLDGIPLAIELAAARVRALPVDEIAARLQDRFRLLVGGRRTALPRQQTLRALVDWSYDLLEERERAGLRRLSVFAGGFTLDAAEQVCAAGIVSAGDVVDVVTALVDRSLVLPPGPSGRYAMLETIREYAEARLDDAGEERDVRSRHADYFLTLAERAEPQLQGADQAAWLARLDREHGNLRRALQTGIEGADPSRALLAAAGLRRFWEARGFLHEGRRWLDAGLEVYEGEPLRRARALRISGILAQQQGDYAAAEARHEQSLRLGAEAGDESVVADATHNLAGLAYFRGDLAGARDRWERALQTRRRLGDASGVADSLANIAVVAAEMRDDEGARDALRECIGIFREAGDLAGVADAYANLGFVEEKFGDAAAAREAYEESLRMRRELGDLLGIANSLSNLGGIARDEMDPARARALFDEAVAILREADSPWRLAHALEGLGAALHLDGRAEQAGAALQESLAIRRGIGDRDGVAQCLEAIGALAAGRDPAGAARLLGAAGALRRALGTVRTAADDRRRESALSRVREAIGEGPLDSALREGEAIPEEESAALALTLL